MHDEYDFGSEDAYEYVKQLIGNIAPNSKLINNSSHNKYIKESNENNKNRFFNEEFSSKKTKYQISNNNLLDQKNYLQLTLNKIFDNDLVTEKEFKWLKTPKNPEKTYSRIYNALRDYNDGEYVAKNNFKLHCDFVSESNKIIIEYDERQHFTEPRRISLLNYPNIPVYFDKEKWIKASADIQADGNSLYNSDVARAYYDSVRDIESYKHGYKLFRIMHGEFDFKREDSYGYLKQLLKLN